MAATLPTAEMDGYEHLLAAVRLLGIEEVSGVVRILVTRAKQEGRPRRVRTKYAGKKLAMDRACGRCEACGRSSALHVHHVVPKSKGGGNEASNLRVLCANCHHSAHHPEGTKAL